MNHLPRPCRVARDERGAAALIVTTMLFLAMALTFLFVNRNLVFEQRSSVNQYRSSQAFEAAEAGLEWALVRLNNAQPLDADCQPSADAASSSFRTRFLVTDDSGTIAPVTWNHAGVATPLQPSCVRFGAGWSCSCPAHGLPTLTPAADTAPAAAFMLQFLPTPKAGVVRVRAIGCTSLAGACLPGSATIADATARADITLGLFAALRTPPAAALTARGAVRIGTASMGVHNPATGISIHAGEVIDASAVRLGGAAGAGPSGTLAANDTALAALSTDRFFASYFGVDKATWRSQVAVTRIACGGSDCGRALAAAVAAASDNALIWVDGDLTLNGPLTLGSPQRPVLIVASGAAHVDGALALSGVIYSATMRWDGAGSSALVRGAVIVEGDHQGHAAPEIVYDSAVIAVLSRRLGSFARVSGSWRDF